MTLKRSAYEKRKKLVTLVMNCKLNVPFSVAKSSFDKDNIYKHNCL